MATLQIRMKDGLFAETNGCYISKVEPTHVVGNGWDCKILDDGSIKCYATKKYSYGKWSMRYIIRPNGFAKLSVKNHRGEVKTLRTGFVVPKGTTIGNGILGLAGGRINERYAYYRDIKFQKFLEKFGITAVKHEDPNQTFEGFSALTGIGSAFQEVYSDGKVEKEYEDDPGSREEFEQPGCNSSLYKGTLYHTVTGASWAIVETYSDYLDSRNYAKILYTKEKNVMALEDSLMNNRDIANYVREKAQRESLNKFNGREISTLEFIKDMMDEIKSIAPKAVLSIDEEEIDSYLESHNKAQGFKITVEVQWHYEPDFEIVLFCQHEEKKVFKQVKIAEGFLG